MKPRVNYRAERADRTRAKAEKKAARLLAKSKKSKDSTSAETPADETIEEAGSPPNVHRFSD